MSKEIKNKELWALAILDKTWGRGPLTTKELKEICEKVDCEGRGLVASKEWSYTHYVSACGGYLVSLSRGRGVKYEYLGTCTKEQVIEAIRAWSAPVGKKITSTGSVSVEQFKKYLSVLVYCNEQTSTRISYSALKDRFKSLPHVGKQWIEFITESIKRNFNVELGLVPVPAGIVEPENDKKYKAAAGVVKDTPKLEVCISTISKWLEEQGVDVGEYRKLTYIGDHVAPTIIDKAISEIANKVKLGWAEKNARLTTYLLFKSEYKDSPEDLKALDEFFTEFSTKPEEEKEEKKQVEEVTVEPSETVTAEEQKEEAVVETPGYPKIRVLKTSVKEDILKEILGNENIDIDEVCIDFFNVRISTPMVEDRLVEALSAEDVLFERVIDTTFVEKMKAKEERRAAEEAALAKAIDEYEDIEKQILELQKRQSELKEQYNL